MSTTLQAIEQEAAKKLGWYSELTTSTGSSGSTQVVAAAVSHLDTDDASADLQNAWLRCESDSNVTPQNVGETRRLKTYTTSSQTIVVSNAYTNTPRNTQVYGVWKSVPPERYGFEPGWKEYINRTLRDCRYRRLGLLTLGTDGDMESDPATNWTGTNATLAALTTAATVSRGAKALSVTNTLANGYASRGTATPATAGDTYCLRADVRVSVGTAYLVAWDVTNGAEITSESSTYTDWRALSFTFLVPSGCTSVNIRLKGSEITAVVYWDNVSLRPQQAYRMPLPSWVDTPNAVEGLVSIRQTMTRDVAEDLTAQDTALLPHFEVEEDPLGVTPWRVIYRFRPADDALLFCRGLSRYDELTTNTATTVADKDLIVAGAIARALTKIGGPKDPESQSWWAEYRRRKAALPHRKQLIPGVWA